MRVSAAEVIRQVLTENELEFTESEPGVFAADLPGERKLKTTVTLTVGAQSLQVHAFVARHPDENHAAVYRWLLERNLKMYGVAFAVDGSPPGTSKRRPGQIRSGSSRVRPSSRRAEPWFRSKISGQRISSPSRRAAIERRLSPSWTT